MKLFERSTRGAEAMENGRSFIEQARRIDTHIDYCKQLHAMSAQVSLAASRLLLFANHGCKSGARDRELPDEV